MNNTSPLIPQGATPPRPKSSLYFKILMVLSVHVVVIGGMLLQGCKDTSTQNQVKADSAAATSDTMAVSAASSTNPATATTDMPAAINANISNSVAGTIPVAAPAGQPMATSASVLPKAASTDLNPPAATGEGKEYVIVKGDTMGAIARKNGVSLKALTEANPGVDSKKLQVGHKVQLPSGASAVATTATAGSSAGAAATEVAEVDAYVVKSGDTLSKIAKAHGTTFKKIMAMNDLKTTAIRPGQKLKLPSGKSAVAEPVATPAASASAAATPASASAPMKVSAATPAVASPVAAN